MNRIIRIISALVLLLVLCGCGQQSDFDHALSSGDSGAISEKSDSGPVDEQLKKDLEDGISVHHSELYGYDVSISEYEIERSLTEDTHYSAQIDVKAESVYAEFHYVASVEYTKYDQGWMIDSCNWTLSNYEIVNYPDDEKMRILLDEQGVSAAAPVELVADGERFSYTGRMSVKDNVYILAEYDIITTWVYDLSSDGWLFESLTSGNERFEFDKSLEGIWQLDADSYLSNGTMTISNVAGTEFDIKLDTDDYATEVFHVNVDNCTWEIDEDYFLTLYWDGTGVSYNEKTGPVYLNLTFYKSAHTFLGPSYTSRWLIYVGPNYYYKSAAYI